MPAEPMIIKPNLGSRIFWGAAGATMLILACAGIGVPFPGLLFTCLGLPIAVFSFGYAFGAAHTRVDDEGLFQRNFFFTSKKFPWSDIESARVVSYDYQSRDSSGWTRRRTHTYMQFTCAGKNLNINKTSSGLENWWTDLHNVAAEKLGDKFQKTASG